MLKYNTNINEYGKFWAFYFPQLDNSVGQQNCRSLTN